MKKYTPKTALYALLKAIIYTTTLGMILTLLNWNNHTHMMVSFPWKCSQGLPPCNPVGAIFPYSNFFILFFPILYVQEIVIPYCLKTKETKSK